MADQAATNSAQVPVSETTPLLTPNVEPVQAERREQTGDLDSPNAADRTIPVVIATWLELITGVLCVPFGIACAIIRSASPVGFHFPWTIKDMIPSVVFLVRTPLRPCT
jgi:hypothetical protein